MSYEIKQDFIHYNNPNKALLPQGTTLHSTATPGATDEREQDFFDEKNRDASAHAFVDWDSITQTIDWYKRAWHGGPTANSKFIGVELCEPKGYDPIKFNEVWKRGIWLFSYIFINILKIKVVTKDNLLSHDEVSKKYKDTDHTDPVAYFKTYGKTVDDFRKEVQEAINNMANEHWAMPVFRKAFAKGLITGNKDLDAPISWAEFLTILDRLHLLE